MDRNTGEKSCANIAADFCGFVSGQWNRFCTWLSINIPLFFRRMRRWNWKPTFSNCFKSWRNEEEDKRNLSKSDTKSNNTCDTFEVTNQLNKNGVNPGANLKHRTSPLRGSMNPLAISVVRIESMNSDDAKEIERTNSKKMVKAIRNPERKKPSVTSNVANKENASLKIDRVPTPIPSIAQNKIDTVVTTEVTDAAVNDIFTKLEQLDEESDNESHEELKPDDESHEESDDESHIESDSNSEEDKDNLMSMTAYINSEQTSNNNLMQQEDVNVINSHTDVLDDDNYKPNLTSLMETVALHADDDHSDEEPIKKEIFEGDVSAHEDHEVNATVVNAMTDNEKFSNNLKANLTELAGLKEGVKLWIDQGTQKIYSDSRYVGQSWTRSFSGQSKSLTLDFIQRMMDTAKLLSESDEEIASLLENTKQGVKNIKNTYFNQSWYGKYDEVKQLEKMITNMGWQSDDEPQIEGNEDKNH